MYLNEAGRMHAISGETVSAAKFFRLALEAALSKHNHKLHAHELEGQTMMILASLYDQGLLAGKGTSSWASWRVVLTSNHLDSQGAAVHAVERWLCFHAGSWQGDCLAESISRLVPLVTQCPQLLYHLSLVHALRGDAKMSHRTYCEFREKASGSNLPGEEMIVRRIDNPWLPLVEVVKQQGHISHIPILWRTQLRPLCLQTDFRLTQEADVISEQLNLRLTPQGLLTADMQLLLPPCSGVYLNPYTGKLMYNINRTEPWRAVMKDSWGLVLPTPLVVYHDEEGVEMELLMTSQMTLMLDQYTMSYPVSPIQDACYLVWCGLDGKKVKVNLVPKFSNLIYEFTKESLKKLKFYPDSLLQEALDMLDILYKRGCAMEAQAIQNLVYRYSSATVCTRTKTKKQSKSDKKKKRKKKIKERKLSFKLYTKPFIYGKTVAMIFQASPEKFHKMLVIVNCSSAESFQNMKLYHIQDWALDETQTLTPGQNPVSVIRPAQFQQGYRIQNADIIHLHFLKPKPRLEVFDQEGSIIDTICIKMPGWKEDRVCLQQGWYRGQIYPVIVKDQLIAVTEQKRLWCRSKGEDFTNADIEGVTSLAVCGDIVIVLTETNTQFLAANQLRVLGIQVTVACQRNLHLKMGENGREIDQSFETVQVLATQNMSRNNVHFLLCLVALDRTIVFVEAPTDMSKCSEVTLSLTICVAGYPVEAYIINKSAGFLLTFTQHTIHSEGYIEHLCHYNFDGQLLGILPCLGPGPRSFCHAYLPGDPEGGGKGLYLYMRDGHNGIVGIQLEDHQGP